MAAGAGAACEPQRHLGAPRQATIPRGAASAPTRHGGDRPENGLAVAPSRERTRALSVPEEGCGEDPTSPTPEGLVADGRNGAPANVVPLLTMTPLPGL